MENRIRKYEIQRISNLFIRVSILEVYGGAQPRSSNLGALSPPYSLSLVSTETKPSYAVRALAVISRRCHILYYDLMHNYLGGAPFSNRMPLAQPFS